ncbi:MAG: hypothetical protein QHH26_06240 [Armatimonadota bacterium]|nr:hypothetical protein [Armatimonadota bacterium]
MAYGEASMSMENPNEGRVMTCTARDCMWNENSTCTADNGIMVNFHQDHADCTTYSQNKHVPSQSPGAAQL